MAEVLGAPDSLTKQTSQLSACAWQLAQLLQPDALLSCCGSTWRQKRLRVISAAAVITSAPVGAVSSGALSGAALQAVHTIHEARIVHSDLKPANFLMVEGQLKLIDFGIAKAINSDTTSIARESQVRRIDAARRSL